MGPDEREIIRQWPIGVLGTVDPDGRPHCVPICFSTISRGDSNVLVSVIDEKPKTTTELRRVTNIEHTPSVTVLLDRYDDDWSRLAWIQLRGRATVNRPDDEIVYHRQIEALIEKYPQYRHHDLENRPIIEVAIESLRSWGDLADWAEVLADDHRSRSA